MENPNEDIRIFLSSPQSLDLIEKTKSTFKRKKTINKKTVSKKLLIKNILMEEDLSKLTERQKVLNRRFRNSLKDLDDISLINSGIDIIPYNINNTNELQKIIKKEEDKKKEDDKKEDDYSKKKEEDKDYKDKKAFMISNSDYDSSKKRKISKEERLGQIYYNKLYEDCLRRVNTKMCTIKLKNISDIYKIQIPIKKHKEEEILKDGDLKEKISKDGDLKVVESDKLIIPNTKIRIKLYKKPYATVNPKYILRIHRESKEECREEKLIQEPPVPFFYYPIVLYQEKYLPILHNILLYKKQKKNYEEKCLFMFYLCRDMKKKEESNNVNNNVNNNVIDNVINNDNKNVIDKVNNIVIDNNNKVNNTLVDNALHPTPIHLDKENTNSGISTSISNTCLMKISMYLEFIQISLKNHKCGINNLLIEKLKIILERISKTKCVCDLEEEIINLLIKADQCKDCNV